MKPRQDSVCYVFTDKLQKTDNSPPSAPKQTISQFYAFGEGYTEESPSHEVLKLWLRTQLAKYGISYYYDRAEAVVFCESGWRVDPPHNGVSLGIAQYTNATWHDFGYGDIMNPYNQLSTMARMFSLGLQKRWDCYRLLFPL